VLSGLANVQLTNQSQNATEYLWDFGDGTAPDPTVDPTHVYIEPGTYTITLTAINYNCTTTTSQSVIVLEFGVGIGELLTDADLSIFPNPNQGQFTVELELKESSDLQIELNNVLGQRVYRQSLQQQSYWRKEFDMTSYSKGIYMLSIATENGVLQRRIIID
jgi:PKD repeat protein